MRIAITGATGFIGVPLVNALQNDGHSIVAISRDAASARVRLPGADAVATVDALRTFPECDAVINLAGETLEGRWTTAKKRAIRESRSIGTHMFVESIARMERKPGVLVSSSAVGYYCDRRDEVLDETSRPGVDFVANVCLDWEAAAKSAESLGMRVVLVRTGLVLGKNGGALAPLLSTTRYMLGGPLGSGNQWWPWIHLDDVVGILIHALNTEIHGPINAVSPNPERQKDVANAIGEVMEKPAITPAPGFALRLLLGEFATELLFSRRVLPKATIASGYRFRYPDLQPAIQDLVGSLSNQGETSESQSPD